MLKVFFCRNPIIIILLQIILGLTICVLVAHAAPSSKDSEGHEGRQGRTLGLLTVGAQALSSGVGTAGKILGATVAGIAAVKPLILLGGAKCKLKKIPKPPAIYLFLLLVLGSFGRLKIVLV